MTLVRWGRGRPGALLLAVVFALGLGGCSDAFIELLAGTGEHDGGGPSTPAPDAGEPSDGGAQDDAGGDGGESDDAGVPADGGVPPDAGLPDGGPGDSGTGDGGAGEPTVVVALVPDWGRRGQTLVVLADFPESEVSLAAEAGDGGAAPPAFYLLGTPDFGDGIFFKSFDITGRTLRITLVIDADARTGERPVEIRVSEAGRSVRGLASFFVLPKLQ